MNCTIVNSKSEKDRNFVLCSAKGIIQIWKLDETTDYEIRCVYSQDDVLIGFEILFAGKEDLLVTCDLTKERITRWYRGVAVYWERFAPKDGRRDNDE